MCALRWGRGEAAIRSGLAWTLALPPPSPSHVSHLQGTGCQLAAAHHECEGGGCDQAPQEVLQTQAQQGCPWKGQDQQGPGLCAFPPMASPSPLRTVPGPSLASGVSR